MDALTKKSIWLHHQSLIVFYGLFLCWNYISPADNWEWFVNRSILDVFRLLFPGKKRKIIVQDCICKFWTLHWLTERERISVGYRRIINRIQASLIEVILKILSRTHWIFPNKTNSGQEFISEKFRESWNVLNRLKHGCEMKTFWDSP